MNYLIFLDIDGTLLTPQGVHPRTIQAIEEAHRRGHWVLLNTGRALGNIPPVVFQSLSLSGVVAGLGAYIQLEGETLLSVAMSDDEIVYAMEIADHTDTKLVLEGETGNVTYYGVSKREGNCQIQGLSTMKEDGIIHSVEDIHTENSNLRVTKITFLNHLPQEDVDALKLRFEIFNHPNYAEIGSKGYSKATAMEFLSRRLGIDHDHIIAMGDSYNDIEMLQAAGIAVVMGNGHPDVKPLADFITLPCNEGGVGYAIEQLVLNEK